ncbi:hypothetical protein HRW08_13645 [Streptomyces lunaelactis]|nr:hypothetical protein [Streptomyces lunaelactis]
MSWDERWGFVRGDRRQIQTAVLGSSDSEEPLMLPLEAIELDAFRHRFEHETFWCGVLLGGCGGQLTTKLYTDRVCHFAHHPGPDGVPHVCGRRSRGVASADHLYVKSAAAAWLQGRGEQAEFDFAQSDGAPVGSVVDIAWKRGGLRVHLDQAVPPTWDQKDSEPVLGMSVPVDRDTLIRRWYIHRIRLDSEGTSRRVRIGTEAFARPTEWFALDDCEMTERGLSTPAVEQIVRSRSTRPVSPWPVGRTRKVPDAHARAQVLLRKLADARRVDSVVVVTRVCHDITAMTGVEGEIRSQLTAAVADAEHWLVAQATVRRELFSQLQKAVTARQIKQIRQLLVRANAIASHNRTEEETAIAAAAADCFTALAREREAAAAAKREASGAWRAAGRVHTLLTTLQRRGVGQRRKPMRDLVRELLQAAAEAGDCIDPQQQRQIDAWKARAGLDRRPPPVSPRQAQSEPARRSTRKRPLHDQVARRSWFKKQCPRCLAAKDRECLNDDGVGTGSLRQIPHDERLQMIIDARKSRAERKPGPRAASPSWQVVDVACPDCNAAPGARCTTPSGSPHQSRVGRFKRRFEGH